MSLVRTLNKVILSVVGVLVTLFVIGIALGGGTSTPKATAPVTVTVTTSGEPPTTTAAAVTTTTEQLPKAEAKIILVASQSYCTPDPGNAYMYFTVVFANRGDAEGSVQATPFARYSDGHTSSSNNVYSDIKIPANRWSGGDGVFVGYMRFDYNPQDHYPLSCSVSYNTGGKYVDYAPVGMN